MARKSHATPGKRSACHSVNADYIFERFLQKCLRLQSTHSTRQKSPPSSNLIKSTDEMKTFILIINAR